MAGEYICPNNGRLKKWETCLKTVIISVWLVPIVVELQQHTKPVTAENQQSPLS